MRRRAQLVLRGDSPSTRRVYDGIAAGALTVLVSDETWSVGLPFQCLVPWRHLAYSIAERAFAAEGGGSHELKRLNALAPATLARMQRLSNRYRRDLIWNINGSRVAENVLVTAALRCLPTHVSRRAATRSEALASSLRQLRQQCPFNDVSVACREADGQNCGGCETGELATSTPTCSVRQLSSAMPPCSGQMLP